MAFKLDQIVPWGRSFDEYVRMFGLTDLDLGKTILGCGDGPASFNATMRSRRVSRAFQTSPMPPSPSGEIKV